MNALEKRVSQLLAEGSLSSSNRHFDAAKDSFRQAIVEAEREAGPNAPLLIRPLWSLARATAYGNYVRCAEITEAVGLCARAVEIATRHWSGEPFELAMLLTGYVSALRTDEQVDEAVARATHARDLLLGLGEDARQQACLIVETLMFASRGEQAIPYARAFVQMVEGANDGVLLAHAHYLLTNCLRLAGANEEALDRAKNYVENEAEHAANGGWKDVVRPMIAELEARVRTTSGAATPRK